MNTPGMDSDAKKETITALVNKCGLAVNNFEDKVLIDNLLTAASNEASKVFSVCAETMMAVKFSKEKSIELVTDALHKHGINVVAPDQRSIITVSGDVFAMFSFQQRSKYSSIYVRCWCDSEATKRDFFAWCKAIFRDQFIDGDICGMRWAYKAKHGLTANYMEELLTDVVLEESYPGIIAQYGSLDGFATKFMESDESVLLLQGPPGTGKSRLIRYLMRKLVQIKKVDLNDPNDYYAEEGSGSKSMVLYTTDTDSLKSDELFAMFMTSDEIMFVVEDADNMLRSRASGNDDVHRFLTVSDGIIRNVGRKVVFTTNLPNMNDVDDALTRPGRCFAALTLTGLNKEDALKLGDKVSGVSKVKANVLKDIDKFFEKNKMMTVAEVYKAWKTQSKLS